MNNNNNNNKNMQLDMHDLDDDIIQVDLLRDMREAGYSLPRLEQVQAAAEEQRAAAVQYKKQGDLTKAKQALQQFKQWQSKAQKLAAVYQVIEDKNDNNTQNDDNNNGTLSATPVTEEALEQLLLQDAQAQENKSRATQSTTTTTTTQQHQQPQQAELQSPEHYKTQALHYKKQGDQAAALASLRLYKQALVAQAAVAAMAHRQEMIQALQAEISLARQQARAFMFYQCCLGSSGDSNNNRDMAATMAAGWRRYARDCHAYATVLANNATSQEDKSAPQHVQPLQRATKAALQRLDDETLSFVGRTGQDNNGGDDSRLEIIMVALLDMTSNKQWPSSSSSSSISLQADGKKESSLPAAQHLKVVLTAHLPANMDKPDDDVQMEFVPTRVVREGNSEQAGGEGEVMYFFASSQFIKTERATPRACKAWTRRLARKRCGTVEVWYVRPVAPSKGKGLFGRRASTEPPEEILLGSAVLELSDLLRVNFVVLDLPLMQGRKAVGGLLRMAVRSRQSFGIIDNDGGTAKKDSDKQDENDAGNKKISLQGYPHFLLPNKIKE